MGGSEPMHSVGNRVHPTQSKAQVLRSQNRSSLYQSLTPFFESIISRRQCSNVHASNAHCSTQALPSALLHFLMVAISCFDCETGLGSGVGDTLGFWFLRFTILRFYDFTPFVRTLLRIFPPILQFYGHFMHIVRSYSHFSKRYRPRRAEGISPMLHLQQCLVMQFTDGYFLFV